MENRFGLKDLIIAVLLVAIIVMIGLGMRQFDRQYDNVVAIDRKVDDLAGLQRQVDELRAAVEAMGIASGTTDATQRELAQIRVLLEQLASNTGDAEKFAAELKAMQERIAQAQASGAVGSSLPPTTDPDGPFGRLLAARDMPGFARGDWFVDAFGVAVKTLTPLVSGDVYQRAVEQHIIQSLATRDPVTLEWVPLLAKSWTVSEDGLVVTFKLREGIKFSTGDPFTAKDVVFSFNWIMNPKVDSPREKSYYSTIESVTASGDYEVTFKLTEKYFQGFEICAGMSILCDEYYGKFSEDEFNKAPGLLMGSGPYKLAVNPLDWKPGSGEIVLVRNELYWGVAPAIERIVYREITDETARLVAFRNGEIDRFGPSPEQYLKLKVDADLLRDNNLYEYETIVGGYRYVAWNQQRNGKPTIFADRRVRQALALLANRQAMADELMVGLATPTSGPFHRLGKQANPDVKPWPHDVEAAKKLLAEAGWADRNNDGVLENAEGTPFKFKLVYPSSSVNYQQMVLYLKDAYARAGIALDPDPLEWTIMVQRLGTRDFDAISLGWSGSIESDPFQIFHSKSAEEGGDNYINYRSAELDKYIDAARVEMDEQERLKLWHEVHRVLHEDQPYLFMWTTKAVVFVNKRFENVQSLPLGLSDTDEWFVPRDQQKYGR
jgi:peptide/nickel transport system substrate-binding protein